MRASCSSVTAVGEDESPIAAMAITCANPEVSVTVIRMPVARLAGTAAVTYPTQVIAVHNKNGIDVHCSIPIAFIQQRLRLL